jgi:hypothetical protein
MRSQATMGTACAAAHRTLVADTIGIIKSEEGKALGLERQYTLRGHARRRLLLNSQRVPW